MIGNILRRAVYFVTETLDDRHAQVDELSALAMREVHRHERRVVELEVALKERTTAKDAAYSERDQCVALIARMALALGYLVGMGRHEGSSWDNEWRNIVFVDLPIGQVSWHVHDSEMPWFAGIQSYPSSWDGHSTPEKYERTRAPIPNALAERTAERDAALHERNAYKRAKEENDERFILERDEARRERDAAMAELESRRQEVALLGADFVGACAERDAALRDLKKEQDAAYADRSEALADYAKATMDRDAARAERDALALKVRDECVAWLRERAATCAAKAEKSRAEGRHYFAERWDAEWNNLRDAADAMAKSTLTSGSPKGDGA